MRRNSLNLLLCLPLTATLFAQQPRLSIPDDVAVTKDLVYAKYGEKELRLDLYRPKTATGKSLPGIVVIRGGGWQQGDKQGFGKIAAALARRGFATASIEYRVVPDVTVIDCVNDCKAAVRWMRAEGSKYGVRTDRIGAIGGSAGGHLVALLGTSYKASDLDGSGGHAGVSSRIQAVVPMAPVVDFAAFQNGRSNWSGPVGDFFRHKPEMVTKLSSVTYLDRDSAPVLLIHSNADRTVPYAQSTEMEEKCRKAGVPVELVTIEGAPHAFWNGPKWFDEVIDRSAKFFHSVLDR